MPRQFICLTLISRTVWWGGLSAPLSLALYPTWGMAYAPGRISVMAFLNRTTMREVDNQGCVLALPRFEVATLPYL